MPPQRRRPLQLLDLPSELLWHIFSFLQDDKAGKRAICRRLQPMTRRNAFRSAYVHGKDKLELLMQVLFAPPARLSKRALRGVRTIPRSIEHLSLITRVGGRKAAKQGVRLGDIAALLGATTNLESLTLSHRDPLEILVPDRHGCSPPRLPALRSLSISSQSWASEQSVWDVAKLAQVGRFPRLEELDIYFGLSSRVITTTLPGLGSCAPVQQLRRLTICGGRCLASPDLPSAISLFTDLHEVTVEVTELVGVDGFASDLGPLLQAVAFEHLTKLEIRQEDYDELDGEEELPNLTVEANLARFTRLEELYLGSNMFHRAGGLVDILAAHLPALKTLHLNSSAYISGAKLLDYVRKARQLALKDLLIDIFSGYLSGIVPTDHPHDPRVWNGTYNLSDWSDRPRWQRDFTFEQAKQLVALGDEIGVKVAGLLPEAIRVEELLRRETRYLEERHDAVLYDIRGLFEQGEEAETAER